MIIVIKMLIYFHKGTQHHHPIYAQKGTFRRCVQRGIQRLISSHRSNKPIRQDICIVWFHSLRELGTDPEPGPTKAHEDFTYTELSKQKLFCGESLSKRKK